MDRLLVDCSGRAGHWNDIGRSAQDPSPPRDRALKVEEVLPSLAILSLPCILTTVGVQVPHQRTWLSVKLRRRPFGESPTPQLVVVFPLLLNLLCAPLSQ
jgi:hypothetical protein